MDRDFVELSNLQRQLLFDEADAGAGTSKSVAAADTVRRINSGVLAERGVDVVQGRCASDGSLDPSDLERELQAAPRNWWR